MIHIYIINYNYIYNYMYIYIYLQLDGDRDLPVKYHFSARFFQSSSRMDPTNLDD